MVKLRRILYIVFILLTVVSSVSFATTKEQLIQAINDTYIVGNGTYTLPPDIKVKAINYLRTHYFTEDDCTQVMNCINGALGFARELGTTDISKISSEDLQRGLSYVYKAINIAEKAPKIEVVISETTQLKKSNNSIKNNTSIGKDNLDITGGESLEILEEVAAAIEEDDIDYSKYISKDDYEDVEFGELKELLKNEVKQYSIRKFLPCIIVIIALCLTIIIFVIRFIRKRRDKRRKNNEE